MATWLIGAYDFLKLQYVLRMSSICAAENVSSKGTEEAGSRDTHRTAQRSALVDPTSCWLSGKRDDVGGM
jgi:hypothetical protein